MKAKLVLLGSVLFFSFALVAYAEMIWGGQQPDNSAAIALAEQQARTAAFELEKEHQNFVPKNPWRSLNEETNYIKINGVEFCGKILEVQPGGIRVSGDYNELFSAHYFQNIEDDEKNEEFFVANYPFEAAENETIYESQHLMAWYVGTYTYTTVNGGSRTIRKLDYGIPCDPPAELIQKKLQADRIIAQREKQKALEGQTNAVHWLQFQATNGSASAQCSLAEHYLKGQGCETNREQAIYWLTQAASQGDIEASNKLANMK